MDDLIDEVNRALRARGWSARHASRQIGGSPEFVRNLRRGHVGAIPYVVQLAMSGSTRNPLSTRVLSPNCLT